MITLNEPQSAPLEAGPAPNAADFPDEFDQACWRVADYAERHGRNSPACLRAREELRRLVWAELAQRELRGARRAEGARTLSRDGAAVLLSFDLK
jgi:hypothetical protein